MITPHPFLPFKTQEIQKITTALPNLINLSDFYLTEDAATKALYKIKVNKPSGPDCIAPKVLQYYSINLKILEEFPTVNVTHIQKKELNPYQLTTNQSASYPCQHLHTPRREMDTVSSVQVVLTNESSLVVFE